MDTDGATGEGDVEKEVRIDDVAHGGDGVGRTVDGRAIFVPRTVPGDVVDVRIEEDAGNYLKGSIDGWHERSEARVDPDCPYFERCGGCQFWQAPYERELAWKSEAACELIERNADTSLSEIDIQAAPSDRRYRTRVRFHWRRGKKDSGALGLFEHGSRELVEVEDCLVADDRINRARRRIPSALRDVGPAEVRIESADASSAVVSIHPESGDVSDPPDSIHAFAQSLEDEPSLRGIRYVGDDRDWVGGDCSVDGDQVLAEPPVDSIRLPAGLFRQANPEVNRRLVRRVETALAEVGAERVLELFCGAGNFSFPVSEGVDALLGIEIDEVAVEMAETMAAFTNRDDLVFLEADLGGGFASIDWVDEYPFDTALLDPPRGGASEVCRDLVESSATGIVYVSCDAGAFGRDLEILQEGGWRLRGIELLDMFPRTAHVEILARLERDA